MPSARPPNQLRLLPPTSAERPLVLFVDDEPQMLGLIPRLFEHEGVEVIVASNGRRALLLLEERGEPAVVVSDYKMPNMDGISLLDAVVARWPGARTLLLSAAGDSEVVHDAAVHRHKALSKNVPIALLREAVMREVRRPRRR